MKLLKDTYYFFHSFLAVVTFTFLSISPAIAADAVLSWDIPSTYTSGSQTTDIAGFKVYYGTESENYTQSIDVGYTTTYQVTQLAENSAFYFVVTAYDSLKVELGYSSEVIVNTPGTLGRATLVSPSGDIAEMSPTYVWNSVTGATDYILVVKNESGTAILDQTFTADEAGCGYGASTCYVIPSFILPDGKHSWNVKAVDLAGTGNISAELAFGVFSQPPAQSYLSSPQGEITETSTSFVWQAVKGSYDYQFVLELANRHGGATLISQWFAADEVSCSSGIGSCSIIPNVTLEKGKSYTWFVRARNSIGLGQWSGLSEFKVKNDFSQPTEQVVIVTPDSNQAVGINPTVSWKAMDGVVDYHMVIEALIGKSGQTVTLVSQWVSVAEAGCQNSNSICSITLGTSLYTEMTHNLFMRARNYEGVGPWSGITEFFVE